MPSTLLAPAALPGIVQPLDWVYGLQAIAHGATSLFYQTGGQTEEVLEDRNAFVEKRPPDFTKFRHQPW